MSIPALLVRDESVNRRHDVRWRVRFETHGLDCGPKAPELKVHNASASGLLLETDQPLQSGTCMIIELPAKVCKVCRTVWNRSKFHGAVFPDPLSMSELRHLVGGSNKSNRKLLLPI
jgi:hypothetical protein